MIKYGQTESAYEIVDYDMWGNEEVEGVIFTDTSKSSICKKLGLDDPYKIDVDVEEDSIYVIYEGKFYCELRKIDR